MFHRRDLKFHIATLARMTATDNSARIGVDVGGTFTDVVLQRADGSATIRKLLSTPPNYDAAVVAAVAGLTDGSPGVQPPKIRYRRGRGHGHSLLPPCPRPRI